MGKHEPTEVPFSAPTSTAATAATPVLILVLLLVVAWSSIFKM